MSFILQSRRDGMFIDNVENLHFSPVNQRQIRVWYLAGTICLSFYAVPTELKRGGTTFFYKHIVPTGLKGPHWTNQNS